MKYLKILIRNGDFKNLSAKGVTRVAGGSFVTSYDEGDASEVMSPSGELRILQAVVRAYNASGGPGQFEVRKSTEGRFAVIGVNPTTVGQSSGIAILDTPINLPVQTRTADRAVHDILDALSSQSGRKVAIFSLPNNRFSQTTTSVGGQGVTARKLLTDVCTATGGMMYWDLFYDTDAGLYAMNIYPTSKAFYDAFGNRVEMLVGSPDQ